MEATIEKKPIYDERVNEILRGMVEGKNRDELAIELGYKNYKTLDIYMRRKNFAWDRDRQAYIPAHNRIESRNIDISLTSSSKVATVLSLFQKEGADAKTIAKRLGFADHRDLATYMKSKGYKWSSDKGNYQKEYGQLQQTNSASPQEASKNDQDTKTDLSLPSGYQTSNERSMGHLDRFGALLDLLDRNKDRLIDLIVPGGETGKVPRYTVPGIFVTKSVHMTNTLDQLVREYSKEWNISQRDIFSVALIEFFQRYGYEREINTLLSRK